MTLPTRAQFLTALGLVSLAFVIGHGTRKTIEVEKIREVQVQAQQQVTAAKAETATAKSEAAAAKTRTIVHTVYVHGEPVEVTKEVVREVEKKHEEQAVRTETKVVTETQVVYQDRERVKLVAPALPRWSLGLAAGLNLGRRFQADIDGGLRLGGSLWGTGKLDIPNRAATVGLRLEF